MNATALKFQARVNSATLKIFIVSIARPRDVLVAEGVEPEFAPLLEAAPKLLAGLEDALSMMPTTWAGCAGKGTWKGPGAERYSSSDECPCHMHDRRRVITAAIAAARGTR